ncbi:Fibronectin type 3 and ankyrin repeat domains protein 1 [Daldinia childiae]|uniref:Fibronectin type 3 and ankyrin repeat domains protein 1 n=1 Tax=Daldinia childiae TaxID=326645 RepID=UPI001446BC67|nr:Fibronectin type 3 and ankyrin repeat domains protein 1 [Daldinia childiae]KAF3062306.1 Fibronectin type 3 and ankyrin repeat domains protein 1 [Daldinia childiae]
MESLEAEDVVTTYIIRKKLAGFSNNLTDKYQDIMDRIMAKLLTQHGADVNTRDPEGGNVLYWAAAGGHVNEVRFLLDQKVNPSITTAYFWAPLHWASANGYIECVKLLLDAGAEVSPVSDTALTPLDLAIEHKKVEIEQLLRSKGAKRGNEIGEEYGGPRYSYRHSSESEDEETTKETKMMAKIKMKARKTKNKLRSKIPRARVPYEEMGVIQVDY